jgi:hypothetical protein
MFVVHFASFARWKTVSITNTSGMLVYFSVRKGMSGPTQLFNPNCENDKVQVGARTLAAREFASAESPTLGPGNLLSLFALSGTVTEVLLSWHSINEQSLGRARAIQQSCMNGRFRRTDSTSAALTDSALRGCPSLDLHSRQDTPKGKDHLR